MTWHIYTTCTSNRELSTSKVTFAGLSLKCGFGGCDGTGGLGGFGGFDGLGGFGGLDGFSRFDGFVF